MSTPTPKAVEKKIVSLINSSSFHYLYDRWQDEKEYEDFEDYKKKVAELSGAEVIRATKRPFSFFLRFPEFVEGLYEVQCTARNGRYRRVD